MAIIMILITLAVIGLATLVWWKRSRPRDLASFREPGAPRDTVILHQFGPAPSVPSISPFVIKLETYLRATKIPYQNRFDKQMGPKGKIPWIQYNDDVVPDSQFCINFLNEACTADLNKRLTSQQKALGHVVRRQCEEWLYWVLIMWRLVLDTRGTLYRSLGLPSLVVWYLRRVSRGRTYDQGIGRHSQAQVTQMMTQDLNALEELLGERSFLFGDTASEVTEFDCAVFGQLSQLVWQTPGCGVHELINENHPRLVAYCQRMKEAFWPDWDERLLKQAKTDPQTPEGTSATTATSAKAATTATTSTSTTPKKATDTESSQRKISHDERIPTSSDSLNNRNRNSHTSNNNVNNNKINANSGIYMS